MKLGGRVRRLLHLIHLRTTGDSGLGIVRGCCLRGGGRWFCFGRYVDENLRAAVSWRCIVSVPNWSKREVLVVRLRDSVEIIPSIELLASTFEPSLVMASQLLQATVVGCPPVSS